jgi:hypothetical protein
MSSEQAYPGSDLRSAARDYQRDAEHKAKYAFGVTFTQGRGEANPRPTKTSEVYVYTAPSCFIPLSPPSIISSPTRYHQTIH